MPFSSRFENVRVYPPTAPTWEGGMTTATISMPRTTSMDSSPDTAGQYVSGMARCFATTGSQAMQAKVHRLVSAYAETVEPAGKFYQGYRLPGYTFDKTCCGL